MLSQVLHVQVAGAFEPVLVGLDGQRPHQPQTAFAIGEDAHHVGAPLQFLIEALEHVGRLHMLVMGKGQPIIAQRFLDVFLDPVAELRMLGLPLGQPGGDVAAHLDEFAPVIDPAQLLQAVVGELAWQMAEGVSEEVHIAALPDCTRQDLADRLPQTFVIVRDDELDAKTGRAP